MSTSSSSGDVVANRPLSEIKAELFKALGHPGRVRILEVLRDGDRTVADLLPLVGLESSHLSQQLGVLRRARVVMCTGRPRRSCNSRRRNRSTPNSLEAPFPRVMPAYASNHNVSRVIVGDNGRV